MRNIERAVRTVLVIAGVVAGLHGFARADDAAKAEARRRNDELVKRGVAA